MSGLIKVHCPMGIIPKILFENLILFFSKSIRVLVEEKPMKDPNSTKKNPVTEK